ncbi:hypothetical protein [Phreatobacter stygius]|uniref:DUF2783 domain-containing protein n=1 Tax=Phreatobacter stygius TaxID=1940610 RepID=A0A4D7BAK7_9HYPH|nr:hypothetical protein [Phreatobacter stygius]QCI67723.1 hypothetical protein E8M01_27975 [Phreatobacter stygius]
MTPGPAMKPKSAPKPLPFDKLEQVYERLAEAIDQVGEANEAVFLAKLVMVLAHRAGEAVDFADCLKVAAEDLEKAPDRPVS